MLWRREEPVTQQQQPQHAQPAVPNPASQPWSRQPKVGTPQTGVKVLFRDEPSDNDEADVTAPPAKPTSTAAPSESASAAVQLWSGWELWCDLPPNPSNNHHHQGQGDSPWATQASQMWQGILRNGK